MILELSFGEVVSALLQDMLNNSTTFALKGGEQAYYIEGVLKEVNNKTALGEQFAKVVLGMAIELAVQNSAHHDRVKKASQSAEIYLNKYLKIKPPDCVNK